jgi:hypothetical protein
MIPDHRQDIVLTIAERNYLFGAAALYNSLAASGFNGEFVVFCRRTDDMCQRVLRELQDDRQPRVNFRIVDTPRHLAMQKAAFMSDCFSEWPGAECVTYFDPDILVNEAPWSWIREWCEHGVALAADTNWDMPSRHPIRNEWERLLKGAGYTVRNRPFVYFNAGFVSVARKNARFCGLWDHFIDRFGANDKSLEAHGEIKDWPRKGRWETIELPDQDTLNMAAMAWEGDLSAFGPDLMGFAPGNCHLPHALGSPKPWRRSYLAEAIRGMPPRLADKVYWENALSPVSIAGPMAVKRKRLAISLAAAFGRVYSRR